MLRQPLQGQVGQEDLQVGPWPRRSAAALTFVLAGCDEPGRSSPTRPAPPPVPSSGAQAPGPQASPGEPRFVDITRSAGIGFVHDSGARGQMHVPETNSGGGGFWDPDADGLPDLLLLAGAPVAADGVPPSSVHHYANLGDGRFANRTREAGLVQGGDVQTFAAADVDGDGREDLVVGGWQVLRLFLADGRGGFRDATAAWGLSGYRGFANALAFVDGPSGRPDLVVGAYTDWTPEVGKQRDCRRADGEPTYCGPQFFNPGPLVYFGNTGAGWVDRSKAMGFVGARSKALGMIVIDHDHDGDRDVFVVNDTHLNLLFEREGPRFDEVGLVRGLVTLDGFKIMSGMGVDAADVTGDGRLCFAIGNFTGEAATLHCQMRRPEGGWTTLAYEELSSASGLSAATMPLVTFGVRFADLDLDGAQELLLTNGHVEDSEHLTGVPHAQPTQVFSVRPGRTGGGLKIEEITPTGGLGGRPVVGRGLAVADIDGDGDPDVLVGVNGAAPMLLRNDTPARGRPLAVSLRGSRPGDRGLGATAVLKAGGLLWLLEDDGTGTGSARLGRGGLELTF